MAASSGGGRRGRTIVGATAVAATLSLGVCDAVADGAAAAASSSSLEAAMEQYRSLYRPVEVKNGDVGEGWWGHSWRGIRAGDTPPTLPIQVRQSHGEVEDGPDAIRIG